MSDQHVRRVTQSTTDERQRPADSPRYYCAGVGFDERSIWTGLFYGLRDALFPSQLPPLELTSTPIATPDRMDSRTNPWAVGTATLLNTGLVALLIAAGLHSTLRTLPPTVSGVDVPLKDFTLFAPASTLLARGGGGGGARDMTDPVMGRLPKRAEMLIVPPQVPVIEKPIIAADPSVLVPLDMKIPDNPSLVNLGVPKSLHVKLASNGPGAHAGIGTGANGGDGPGHGPGVGPGSDGGFGGQVYQPGVGGVSKPVLVVSTEAEFSDEARRQKYQGICMISIIVDAHGNPQNLRVTRSLGMGLDEKALEAVRKYHFKPAMKDGKPVASAVNVEVNFRLY